MNEFDNEVSYKTSHPILGVVLGVIGIVAAIVLAFLTGVIGGGISLAFGLAALILGILAVRDANGGVGAIITGVLAIVLSLLLTGAAMTSVKMLRDHAHDSGNAPLVEQYSNQPQFGILGVVYKIASDNGNMDAFMNELHEITGVVGTPSSNVVSGTSASAAPAADPAGAVSGAENAAA